MDSQHVTMKAISKLLDSKLENFLKKKIGPIIKSAIEPLISPLVEENRALKEELTGLRREVKESQLDTEEDAERRMAETEDEARKSNLVFHGLDRPTSESAITTVEGFINNQLGTPVDAEDLLCAQHIGGSNTVVEFRDYSKKKEVLHAMKEKAKEENTVTAKCDYSARSRRARSKLFQLFLDLKSDNRGDSAPRLAGGKVTVGETEYLLHERRECVEVRVRNRREKFIPIPPSRQPERSRRVTPRSQNDRTEKMTVDTDPSLDSSAPSPSSPAPLSTLTPEEVEEVKRLVSSIRIEVENGLVK